MKHQWAKAGLEPSLSELLSDPITHQLLKRDRLSPEMVWSAIRTAQHAMRRRSLQTVDGVEDSGADGRETSWGNAA